MTQDLRNRVPVVPGVHVGRHRVPDGPGDTARGHWWQRRGRHVDTDRQPTARRIRTVLSDSLPDEMHEGTARSASDPDLGAR